MDYWKLNLNSIDNVFRIGKQGKYSKRNISITFMRVEDKEMVFRAKSATKDDEGIKFYLNDDTTLDGRSLKSKLKRIVSAATTVGRNAKLAGNKVVIDSRAYASNELSLLPKDVSAFLKQEKEIDDGIVYRGEYSTFSNFFPAPFTIEGINYAHVEQHFQSVKALHHGESDTADRIMAMSNPLRIKALGDSIDNDEKWYERRMLVLYDGVRAKFEQNLTLQEELLATAGKHFYEATTDSYFGCGIGFESKRWQIKDWSGENVAGLIVRKVRDELLGVQPDISEGNNTLVEIASQESIDSSSLMETTTSLGESCGEVPDNQPPTTQKSTESCRSSTNTLGLGRGLETLDGDERSSAATADQSQAPTQRGRGKGRGRGRGRGKGPKGSSQRAWQQPPNNRNIMTDTDRNFLGIKERGVGRQSRGRRSSNHQSIYASTPRPKMMNWSYLTESQKQGLAKLGLTPDLISTEGFFDNNVSNNKV